MIPIRDTSATRNYPVVNMSLIGLNVLVFLVQMSTGAGLDRFIYTYGLVPARYSVPAIADYFTPGQQAFSLLSFMFLHGGFLHLLGNMWSLYIFGDNIEDKLGPARYLAFYLLCGLASGLVHMALNYHSRVPTIGASGAIAGVMGAYFVLHPNNKILTLIPIFFIPWFVEIPAFFFLGIWFLIQFFNAAGSHGAAAGIAWWAHVGGFVAGVVFLKAFAYLPDSGVTRSLRRITARRGTHRFQVIRPAGPGDQPDLYGVLAISPHEARAGAQKLINVSWGLRRRLVRVSIPPGMADGGKLRLRGMGKEVPGGERGDLYLRISVQG